MQWELLVPRDFERSVREDKVCVLTLGTLERHGEHMPYGSDALIVHKIAVEAAKLEPCVVFPPFYFGQIHESAERPGTIALSSRFMLELLEEVCDQIGRSGFEKIIILNGHGGNNDMLKYFAMSNLDRKTPYSIYTVLMYNSGKDEYKEETKKYIEYGEGHAGDWETSLAMAVAPDSVKLEYSPYEEPIRPQGRTAHLGRIHTGFSWYGNFPEKVTGCPSLASREKGEKLMDIYIRQFARDIAIVKADNAVPTLQREFYDKLDKVDKK